MTDTVKKAKRTVLQATGTIEVTIWAVPEGYEGPRPDRDVKKYSLTIIGYEVLEHGYIPIVVSSDGLGVYTFPQQIESWRAKAQKAHDDKYRQGYMSYADHNDRLLNDLCRWDQRDQYTGKAISGTDWRDSDSVRKHLTHIFPDYDETKVPFSYEYKIIPDRPASPVAITGAVLT